MNGSRAFSCVGRPISPRRLVRLFLATFAQDDAAILSAHDPRPFAAADAVRRRNPRESMPEFFRDHDRGADHTTSSNLRRAYLRGGALDVVWPQFLALGSSARFCGVGPDALPQNYRAM